MGDASASDATAEPAPSAPDAGAGPSGGGEGGEEPAADGCGEASQAALAAVRAVVKEVRELKGEGEDSPALLEAKRRLATALYAAKKAGVSAAALLAASTWDFEPSAAAGEAAGEDAPGEPCEKRWPNIGDRVCSASGDAEVTNTGWKLAAGAWATVEAIDRDGDFKLRNGEGEVSGFLYRSDYVYSNSSVAKEAPGEPCTERMPVEGDRVFSASGEAEVTPAGWKLAAGAVAVVESVDEDGDFKLRNPVGEVSGFLYRSDYVYSKPVEPEKEMPRGDEPFKVGDHVEIFGLKSETGAKLNGKVGIIVEWLDEKERFIVANGPERVGVKPGNLKRYFGSSGTGNKRSRSQSSSSSASSSPSKAKKSKKSTEVSPDEAMNKLLTKLPKPKKDPQKAREEEEELRRAAEERRKVTVSEEAMRAAGAAAAAAAAAAAQAAAGMGAAQASVEPLKPGDPVEVYGLQSEKGQAMNGKKGLITSFIEETGRFQVELGMSTLQSLKSDNLRRILGTTTTSASQSRYSGPSAGYTLL